MLSTLTDEQKALVPIVRDEWIAHGLSTQPADRDAAASGIRATYRAAGLAEPQIILWLDSPMAGALGAAWLVRFLGALAGVGGPVRDEIYRVEDRVKHQVWNEVGGTVRARVGKGIEDQVRHVVGTQVMRHVRDQIKDQVGDHAEARIDDQVAEPGATAVRAEVWGQLVDQVTRQVAAQVGGPGEVWCQFWDRDQVGLQVADQVANQVWAQVRSQIQVPAIQQWPAVFYGQHAVWLAYYDYWGRLGVLGPERLAGLMQVARSAGWSWLYRGAAVLTERPAELHLDAEGRLHNEGGPAVLYRDGWGVWAIHGERVPRGVVEHPDRSSRTAPASSRPHGKAAAGISPMVQMVAPYGEDPADLVELVEWLIDSHEINITMCGATEAWVSINEEERVLPGHLAPLLCTIAAGRMHRKDKG